MSNAPIPSSPPSASFKARFWDRFALGYAGGAIGDWAGYERSLARTRELLGPGASVLEIGCGTGSTALTLSLFTGPYRAADIAPQMITVANQRLAASPRPNLRFVVEDADATASEAAGPFDAVLAFNLLHLLDDLDAATARCARVLRPGGLFISKTACLGEMNPLLPGLAVPLMRLVRLAPPVLVLRAADLAAACERQGLEVLAVERQSRLEPDPPASPPALHAGVASPLAARTEDRDAGRATKSPYPATADPAG